MPTPRQVNVDYVQARPAVLRDTPIGHIGVVVLRIRQHDPNGGEGAMFDLAIPAELIIPLSEELPDMAALAIEQANEQRMNDSA